MKGLLVGVVVVGVALFFVYSYSTKNEPSPVKNDYKNIEYVIDGEKIQLIDGVSETESAPGSAMKTVTRYFGNELKADLNGDGREDIAFIITKEGGGSGTFFYAVAAVNTETGYIGSDGYLLGDRIAPQNTTMSPNPKHVGVVVFNYADRAPGEPMTALPSVGKSAYIKLDPETLVWGIVEPNFEGESAWACDGDAYICPDGSSVGRTGPHCEFVSCPSLGATSTRVEAYLGDVELISD